MKQPLLKFVILGPESTGKSTITKQLAAYYHTAFVPEFAREYLETLGRPYTYEDLLTIAKGQIRAEDQASLKVKNGILFCDTDLQVLKVWSEHKYGRCDPWILDQLIRRDYDFYWLTNIDLPWVSDPLREHPQPHMREHFFNTYRNIIRATGKPWQVLSGTPQERLDTAVCTVNQFLKKRPPEAG